MKYTIGAPILLLCLALSVVAGAAHRMPQQVDKPKGADVRTTADAKAGEKKTDETKKSDETKTGEKKTIKTGPGSTVTLRIEISAQGMATLPTGSTIQVKGDDESCKHLEQEQSINSEAATFTNLPVCKVKLHIYITGFDGKTVLADLAKYKEPMRIQVKSSGPPVVD
jgi:hypothetical protein